MAAQLCALATKSRRRQRQVRLEGLAVDLLRKKGSFTVVHAF